MSDTNHGAVGLSAAQTSSDRRSMLDLVNRVHATGVGLEVDLPLIAVIGSQSAGKSCLIEAISGISLPRAAGTCTRCPTECRLTRTDEPWKCLVKLHFSTDNRGQPIPIRNVPFGGPITDKEDVEERIRRAQRAILNPAQTDVNYFLEEDILDEPTPELDFSTNRISLEISGPGMADLSFIDLPGLIQVTGARGRESDVKLVERLVKSYIQKPNCLILLTVTCETDYQTQGAQKFAKKFDPSGNRTIGVLTKPDRIPEGDEELWLKLIRNEEESLKHTWYAVKQPSSADLRDGISWEEARKSEDEFFSTQAPWCDLDPGSQRQLRTSNLIKRLSDLLSDLISEKLPDIQRQVGSAIAQAREQLGKLPSEPVSDPFSEVLVLVHNFIQDVTRNIEGVPESAGLHQKVRPQQEVFRQAIRNTAPEFHPHKRPNETPKKSESSSKGSHSKDTKSSHSSHSSHSKEPHHSSSHSKEPHRSSHSSHSRSSHPKHDGEDGWESDEAAAAAAKSRKPTGMYLEDVLEVARNARTRELSSSYPAVLQQTFVDKFTTQWQVPARTLATSVNKSLSEVLDDLVHQHFGRFGQGELEKRVRGIIQQQIQRCFTKCQDHITWLLAAEERPFTLNEHALADYKDKFLSKYRAERQKKSTSPHLLKRIDSYRRPPNGRRPSQRGERSSRRTQADDGIPKILSGFNDIGMKIPAGALPKILPADVMEPALNIMSDVRAYFQVAFTRFSDNVPLCIDLELIRGTEKGLLTVLTTQLGISGPDAVQICKNFAREEPRVAADRDDLTKKLTRLEKAHAELLKASVGGL